MKFIKTVNLWAEGVEESIRNGSLVLQCGQWVTCGNDGVKSRFVGFNGFTIHCVHGESTKIVTERFKTSIQSKKKAKIKA